MLVRGCRGRSGASRLRGSSVKRARARLRRVIIRAVCRFICPQEVLTGPSITPLQMSGHSEADGPVSASNHSLPERQAGAGLHINMLRSVAGKRRCKSRFHQELENKATLGGGCEPVRFIHPSISLIVAQGDQRELQSGDSCINFPLVEVN